MRRASPLLLAALTLSLAGCFKPEIRQGNFITDEMIAKVKTGMTQPQVMFVMGRPMVQDPFHSSRWDYVRYVNPNDGRPIQDWHVIVYFDTAGKVAKIDQPPVQNKEQQLQLPTVKDASELPQDDQSNGPSTAPQSTPSGYPPPL
ncbi:MAG TPA: outer membrane protein assembly factor BamE [Gammaproteobacteria bacterium]|jgi:outer membrane protein assembly factor BamE